MQRGHILYIEDTIGRGGSLVSMCLLIQKLDNQKFEPYALLYNENQKLYLAQKCSGVQSIVTRPGLGLKSSNTIMTIMRPIEYFGNQSKRAVSFLIFLIDLVFTIVPYVVRVYFKVKKWNLNLVHLNTGVCIPGVLLAMFLRVPCIATQRGPEWSSPVISFFAKFIDLYIANSNATKENVLKLGVASRKIRIVYPPVDLNTFNVNIDTREIKKEFNITGTENSVGILGTLEEAKGHKVLFQAMVEVIRSFPSCRVFVIGDTYGSDEYKEELLDFAKKLGIKENITFTGFRTDVPVLIQILDVVVHASLFPEPFGKVITEGMAMKKPVIATQGGGTSEIIDDGVNGFLIPHDKPDRLAEIIINLISNRELREKIGEAALKKVKTRFAIEQHVIKVENIYDTILSSDTKINTA